MCQVSLLHVLLPNHLSVVIRVGSVGSLEAKYMAQKTFALTMNTRLPNLDSSKDSGDILLFKSQGTFPRLIRAASRAALLGGRYDHVGLGLGSNWQRHLTKSNPPL